VHEVSVQAELVIFSGTRPAFTAAGTRLAALSSLSTEERRALNDTSLLCQSVRAGEELVREGKPTDSIYFLIEGWACRFKLTRDGRRQISTLLAPNDI
jgi:CRP-like cAMP-binding protein